MLINNLIMTLVIATSYAPIELDSSYCHDKWNTQPTDVVRHFRAFTVSFDSNDCGISTGLPEFVAYEIKPRQRKLDAAPTRPSPWIHSDGSPPDESYKGSGLDRGHLCPRVHAWRLGANASKNSHTTLNCAPQIPSFNQGLWRDLEDKCGKWADDFGQSIWVLTGPLVYNHGSATWIGEKGEMPIMFPDAFFKIVVREPLDIIALLYPHNEYSRKNPFHHSKYLVSVDYIELLTGLDFFTCLPDNIEDKLESEVARTVWGENRIQYRK